MLKKELLKSVEGLDLNGYLNMAIDCLIEENAIPFSLESELSFSQLKPEVKESILWAEAHLDELPGFKTVEEMNAWLDAEDEKKSDLEVRINRKNSETHTFYNFIEDEEHKKNISIDTVNKTKKRGRLLLRIEKRS